MLTIKSLIVTALTLRNVVSWKMIEILLHNIESIQLFIWREHLFISQGWSTDDGSTDGGNTDGGTKDGTDNGTDGGTGTDGGAGTDNGTGDTQPTVKPVEAAEVTITSKAIDLDYEKSVKVKSFVEGVNGHMLGHLADDNSDTYWMINESDTTKKRLEFYFEVRFNLQNLSQNL